MKGEGTAHGAITILNASASGIGCSLAIDAPTSATWEWIPKDFEWLGPTDDRLARAVHKRITSILGRNDGARLDCRSPYPPSRGLKTSSAAATALVRAASGTFGQDIEDELIDDICVDASLDAGVTLTGAFDDQVAVSRGGCHITDNMMRRIQEEVAVEPWSVAVWVPEASISKDQLRTVDVRSLVGKCRDAEQLLRDGDVAGAMRANSAAFMGLYQAAGLPVDDRPIAVADAAGALAAGLSGTGPAVAALFDDPTDLPAVGGGTWHWHEVVR